MTQIKTIFYKPDKIVFADQNWVNRLYVGDNLEVLKSLLNDPSVCGHTRLVYIDPPFGTGQTFTISSERCSTISRGFNELNAYHDNVTGKDHLDFMRSRLKLIRELMSDDGSIYVHIDCKMGHYVKILLDDIFGIANFRNDITRIKCNPKNFKRCSYGNVKDMILFYTKGNKFVWNYPCVPYSKEDLNRLFPKVDRHGRCYTTTPLHAPGETKNGVSGEEWNGIKPPPGRHWRCAPSMLTKLQQDNLIEWSLKGNPRKKIFADEAKKRGKFVQDVWFYKDPQYPQYPTEKNIEMLKLIIKASSNIGDIIMDCFCGSGTTLIAAQQLHRCWIGIDNSEEAIKICKTRLGMPYG